MICNANAPSQRVKVAEHSPIPSKANIRITNRIPIHYRRGLIIREPNSIRNPLRIRSENRISRASGSESE